VGRALITLGIVLVVIGLAVEFGPRLPFRIGRLPGDIYVRRGNFSFYFPITTAIVVSIVLSLLLAPLRR